MPILKPISGHTSCAGVYRCLTKNGRALARDFLNIGAPEEEGFDWAAVMDETRHACRNDTPWGDRPAEDGLRSVFSVNGIEIADSSAKAVSCDWVYSMERDQTRRVSGERMRFGYGSKRKGFFARPGTCLRQKCRRIPAIKKPPEGGYCIWSRGLDLNQRPPGYEPGELPDCSTPQCV